MGFIGTVVAAALDKAPLVMLVVAAGVAAVEQDHKGHLKCAWVLASLCVVGVLVVSALWGVQDRALTILMADRPVFDR